MRLIPTRGSRGATTAASDVRRASVGLLVAIAFSAPPALALSVFDTIQLSKRGYSDKEIVDLIEATDSAFDLKAEDLPKLKQLGVSEVVIRAMLERAVTAEHAGPGDAPHETEGAHESEPHAAPSAVEAPHVDAPPPSTARRRHSPFTAYPHPEERSGHHVHLVLALDGLDLLVLRDEGGHPSIESRGRAVIERLGEAWAAGRGRFTVQHVGSGVQVVFRAGTDQETQQTILVLKVSTGDAIAYERRSGRGVTPDLLARYWADLLSDFGAVSRGETPKRLLALHEGEALAVLREAFAHLGEGDRTLGAAAEGVPSSTRHHLLRLAQTVPMEYGHGGAH